MKKYLFPIIVYSALTAICLLYATMAFIDFNDMTMSDPIDIPKLILGLGFACLFSYIVIGYINKED